MQGPTENLDLEGLIKEAGAAWEAANTEPGSDDWWGIYSYGDAPGAIGGGVGSFVWFPTRAKALQFVGNVLPYSPPGRSDMDWSAVASETASIVEEIERGEIDDELGRTRLNLALRTFSQIEWFGTFSDLTSGSHPYAHKVRADYREDEGGSEGADRIPAAEIDEFKQFLAEYGI